ncbi:REST corepressor isoform X2 [Drosophila sulfurigaster albostrigata]|uniref:REST corepressor isoform X2 n=1 Tax=Drosophila sulfurigaster albostrigata TaxID=89887 RepID=UPI002D21DD73|nr:REST corepressor isoform X2 [Drosophila sulfurigaster albostrigata]
MVLSERNTGDIVRNGRRSRGPSPNTHSNAGGGGAGGVGGAANAHNASGGIGGGGGGGGGGVGVGGHVGNNATANDKATAAPGAGTPESSDDDNSTKRNGKSKAKQSEYEEKIRVGRDYQAVCPQLVAEPDRRPELMNERALLVWSPTKEIPDMKLEEYISVAKEKYGYNGEQALGMLFWHKHDLERAVMDLANFTPFPDEWTTEDKVLFEQAFQFHGKSFHRIRQMLPDKSIASLVKYYYSWKKTRHRSSAMDRQEKIIKAAVKEGSENGSEVGSNEESDNDDKRANNNNSTMNNNNNSSNNSNSSSHNTGITTTTQGSNGNGNGNNNNSNSNSTADSSNGGGSSSSGVGSVVGDVTNNNNNDLDSDQLCVYTNALGEDMLGFGVPGFGLSIDNGNENDIDNNGIGNHSGNARRNVVGGFCKNCNVVCYILFDTPLGRMCKSCRTHWRRTGNRRPISGPESGTPTKRSTHNSATAAAAERSRRKPPRGMYINHDDLTTLAGCQNPCEYLAEGDRKIAALLAEIQKNRQMLEQLEKDCSGDAAAAANLDESGESKMAAATEAAGATQATAAAAAGATATAAATTAAGNASTTQHRITARWTQDEISMALLALRDYGKNFPMIAKIVGTKTEAHVRTFYMSYRRRYNLDQIVKEYEASTAKDETGNVEQEQSSDAAAAATATAATGTTATAAVATVAAAGAANDASSQEVLAKKDESTTNNSSKKQKPELNAAKNSESAAGAGSGSGSGVGATTGATANAAGNGTATGTGASKATTITIADESDTATSSSSDVVNNSTALTNSSNSTSSLSGISSGGAPAKSSSSSSTSSTSTNNNHNEAADNSVETTTTTTTSSSLKSTLAATSKRDNSDLNTADLPPAKKMALTVSAEFLAK